MQQVPHKLRGQHANDFCRLPPFASGNRKSRLAESPNGFLLARVGPPPNLAARSMLAQAALRRRMPAMPRSAKPITLSVAGSGSATPRMSMLPLAA
ncbi:MAG: hypothetical protein AW08_01919 [Candidatus Accumulibacter adjunctus]|uniref:Uncharacterized protein n=1 Tax=Candidatus Accumulibacter adjunctus TaxID=1454001 RepID=A0A011MYK7_9PROT|nr:MAG: hypothetical protein AW08_01919 [Candidatus Accumulibacter adjunctus]